MDAVCGIIELGWERCQALLLNVVCGLRSPFISDDYSQDCVDPT